MVMAAILINGPWPFVQIFTPPVREDSTWNLKKIDREVSEKKSFKGVDRRTMDDGQRVVAIAHPEPSAQVS